jgi:hypothetical protein
MCGLARERWWEMWLELQEKFDLKPRATRCKPHSGAYQRLSHPKFEQLRPNMFALPQKLIDD